MKAVRQGRGVTGLLMLLALAGCSSRSAEPPPPNPDEVRAKIVRLMPATVRDRQGWASDIYAAFSAQQVYPSDENLCAVLAVTEQESTYQVDPPVAGLGRIATREVERRAGKLHVPAFLVSSALNIKSPDGRTYSQRLAAARTEKELSETFDDFIAIVPMGGKLFGGFNPVHTGGPMQVSIAFAEQHADGYPYPLDGSIRREVFSRRGGMYFGIAHLLGYPADYPAPLYMSDAAIRRALEQGDSPEFADSALYRKVFALAESATGKTLPRAVLPGIALESPKITRKLTTAWFAKRVDERYQRCMARVQKR